MTGQAPAITLSVVVPVYMGEAYLRRLVDELERLRNHWIARDAPLRLDEAIFVDDAARDGSPALLDELSSEHDWVKVLRLSRNFGQHPATIAGILHSSAHWIVTMDEDLQHPPSGIPHLLAKAVETHCDIVYAAPDGDIHEKGARDLSSRSYKRMMEWLTGDPNIRNVNSFRLLRGQIARGAASVCTHDTYFDVALSWFTKRVEAVPMVLRDERYIQSGKSGYHLRSLMSHARRMLFTSQVKLLRAGAATGLAVVAFSIIAGTALAISKLVNPDIVAITGWTSLILTVTFFGGLSLLLIGIVLEYMSTLVLRAHGKPLFFVIDRTSDALIEPFFRAPSA